MIGTEHSPKSTLIKALNNEHKRKITMEIILPEQLVPVKWVLRSKTKRKKSVRLIILNKNTCKILRHIYITLKIIKWSDYVTVRGIW